MGELRYHSPRGTFSLCREGRKAKSLNEYRESNLKYMRWYGPRKYHWSGMHQCSSKRPFWQLYQLPHWGQWLVNTHGWNTSKTNHDFQIFQSDHKWKECTQTSSQECKSDLWYSRCLCWMGSGQSMEKSAPYNLPKYPGYGPKISPILRRKFIQLLLYWQIPTILLTSGWPVCNLG